MDFNSETRVGNGDGLDLEWSERKDELDIENVLLFTGRNKGEHPLKIDHLKKRTDLLSRIENDIEQEIRGEIDEIIQESITRSGSVIYSDSKLSTFRQATFWIALTLFMLTIVFIAGAVSPANTQTSVLGFITGIAAVAFAKTWYDMKR